MFLILVTASFMDKILKSDHQTPWKPGSENYWNSIYRESQMQNTRRWPHLEEERSGYLRADGREIQRTLVKRGEAEPKRCLTQH